MGDATTDGRRRRGGRPTKPAAPGRKVKLGMAVSPATKAILDGARATSGRGQAEEAERLIMLGQLFEQHGRWTLPVEMQSLAIALLTAHAAGPGALIDYLMSTAPDEAERFYRWNSYWSALASWRANHPIRPPEPEAEEVAAEKAA